MEKIKDSIGNLEFNLATIKRNKCLRGVIFKETRDLFKLVDRKSREPDWKQLIDLIQIQIMELEIELETLKNKENGLINSISDRLCGVCVGNGSDSICNS